MFQTPFRWFGAFALIFLAGCSSRIDEGPLWSYGDFRFESDDPEILEELPRRTIRPGDPAEEDLLDEELENFAAFYRDKGFLHVRGSTTPVPDTLERRVDIVFRFEAGARVRMGQSRAEWLEVQPEEPDTP